MFQHNYVDMKTPLKKSDMDVQKQPKDILAQENVSVPWAISKEKKPDY